MTVEAAQRQVNGTLGKAIQFNIENLEPSRLAIQHADVVISLLPAHFHILVARLCLQEKKHLLTASYVSDEMKQLDSEARNKKLLFLNECGLDPGIDHMSAMQVIDRIKNQGGTLTSFESYTGGLIAPQSDLGNPWRYKFTWNPRNVVMAGQGTAKFLEGGQYKYIPYQQLFNRTVSISVPGQGEFEGYANRDSLKYLETYGLQGIKTLVRGTLRFAGFCKTWSILVQLGCCDDTYEMENVAGLTHRDFLDSFLPAHPTASVSEKVSSLFGLSSDSPELNRLQWSGFFSQEKIMLDTGTPAQITEHILNKKWQMLPGNQDYIVMWHRFRYTVDQQEKEVQAWLTATGEDTINTAMAKTVGLPLAIAAKLVLLQKISVTGVIIPVVAEIYNPILRELGELGISLNEQQI